MHSILSYSSMGLLSRSLIYEDTSYCLLNEESSAKQNTSSQGITRCFCRECDIHIINMMHRSLIVPSHFSVMAVLLKRQMRVCSGQLTLHFGGKLTLAK